MPVGDGATVVPAGLVGFGPTVTSGFAAPTPNLRGSSEAPGSGNVVSPVDDVRSTTTWTRLTRLTPTSVAPRVSATVRRKRAVLARVYRVSGPQASSGSTPMLGSRWIAMNPATARATA